MIPAKLQYTKTTVQIARPSAAPRHRVPPFERNYQAREVKTPARACGAAVTAGRARTFQTRFLAAAGVHM